MRPDDELIHNIILSSAGAIFAVVLMLGVLFLTKTLIGQ